MKQFFAKIVLTPFVRTRWLSDGRTIDYDYDCGPGGRG